MSHYCEPTHDGHSPLVSTNNCVVCVLDKLARDGEGSPADWDKLSTAFADTGRLDLAHWTRQIAEDRSADELAIAVSRAQWGWPPRGYKFGEYR